MSDQTMVERVARALWAVHRKSILTFAEIPEWDDPTMADSSRVWQRVKARAAIEAMQTGEYICPKCGIRHGGDLSTGDSPF